MKFTKLDNAFGLKLLPILSLFLCFSGGTLQAQEEWSLDSNYVKTFDDTWSLRVYGIVKAQGLRLLNKDRDQIRYYPDNIFGIGVGVSYKKIILDLGLTVGGSQNISTRFDFQASLFLRKSIIDIYLQAYQGFRLEAPELDDPARTIRKDIRTLSFGINYLYNFKGDRLAIRATTIGDYHQNRSEGSLLLGGFTSFFIFRADSTLVPGGVENFPPETQLQNIHLNSAGILVGYGQIWSFNEKWSLFASGVPGIGYNGGDLKTEEWFSPPFAPVYKLQLGAGLTYSHPNFYTMLSYSGDYYWLNLGNDNRFSYNLVKIKFSVGYRFNH